VTNAPKSRRSAKSEVAPSGPSPTPPSLDTLLGSARLAAILPLAVIAWSAEGRVLGWNQGAEDLLGWSAQEAIGRSLYEMLPEAMQARMRQIANELLEGRSVYSVNENVTKDGRAITCEWHNTLLRAEDGTPIAALSLARDVTSQRQIERERERLIAIAASSAARNLDEILLLVRNAIIEVEGFDRAGIWLKESDAMYGTWGTDAEGRLKDEHRERYKLEALAGAMRVVALEQKPYCFETYETEWTTDEGAPRMCSCVVVGMVAHGALVGLLCVDNLVTSRPILEADVERLLPFCEQAAIAIENSRLVDERERLQERKRRMMEIAAAINTRLELDKILRMVRDAVVDVAGFDRAGVVMVEGDYARGSWGTDREGQPRDEHDYRAPLTDWFPNVEEFRSGKHAYVLRSLHDPVAQRLYPCVNVGLRVDGELVGILSVDNLLTRRPILDENIEMLQHFTEQAAIAIRNARLFDERERHLDRQRRLASLAAAISASVDLNAILRMVRDAIVAAGGFDRACVFLYDPATGLIQGAWSTDREGNSKDASSIVFSVERSRREPLGQVIRGEVPYSLVDDLTRSYQLPTEDPLYGIRAHAIIPLRAAGVVLGTLSVDNLLSDRPITEADIEGLLPFAEQAAVAIQNARLFAELRQAQDALMRSEKLRAVGELASGVAHNVNNILAAVLGYAELIQGVEGVPAEVAHYARTIERAALDGAEIVRRVQRFARRETEIGQAPFDVAEVTQEALDLTRPVWQHQAVGRGIQIEVVKRLTPGLHVLGHESEIREVLVNLIKNAVEAMPEGGTLTVSCSTEGEQVLVSIEDTGIGMEEATRKRVFEPFFSTKSAGLGTGLGLSVAWGILDRHHGRIEVQSAPGQGSQFRIRLPRIETQPVVRPPSSQGTLEGLRILLVEDEELVLGGLARMLIARGATVEICESANEALLWLEENAERCDMVLSDHGMVGMTGMTLLTLVRDRYPRLRRLLLSGWGANLPDASDLSAAERILTKPIRLDELTAVLQQLPSRIAMS